MDRPPPPPHRRESTWILVAAALWGLAHLLLLPPWMGEDEPWHLEYAHHVAAGHLPLGGNDRAWVEDRQTRPFSQIQLVVRFPSLDYPEASAVQRAILADMRGEAFRERVDWTPYACLPGELDELAPAFSATNQPPPYYLLLGALLAPFGELSPTAQLRLARLFSWPLYLFTVWCALGLGREVFRDRTLALAPALFTAFLPMHARQAAVVNNDVLAGALVAAALLLAARRVNGRARSAEWLALLACAALAPLTKTTGYGALAVAGYALLFGRDGAGRRRAAWPALVAALVAGATALWYLAAGHSAALPHTWRGFWPRFAGGFSLENLTRFGRTLVGTFNWESRILPGFVYWISWLALLLPGLAGLAVALRPRPELRVPALRLCVFALGAQVTLVLLRGMAVGRYALPVLPALAALLSAGLFALVPERHRGTALRLGTALLVAAAGLYLWGPLVLHQYLRWGV